MSARGLKPTIRSAEDVRVCNCANCGYELLGFLSAAEEVALTKLSNGERLKLPMRSVAARLNGRPYCRPCSASVLAPAGSKRSTRNPRTTPGNPDPRTKTARGATTRLGFWKASSVICHPRATPAGFSLFTLNNSRGRR
mgnify:CR=1 FL=1